MAYSPTTERRPGWLRALWERILRSVRRTREAPEQPSAPDPGLPTGSAAVPSAARSAVPSAARSPELRNPFQVDREPVAGAAVGGYARARGQADRTAFMAPASTGHPTLGGTADPALGIDVGRKAPSTAEGTVHVRGNGRVYSEAQWTGQRNDEQITTEVRRSAIDLQYVSRDGSILGPEALRGLDREARNGLTPIDLNRVPVGFAAPDGRVFTAAETRGADLARSGLTPVDLSRTSVGYAAADGRIFGDEAADRTRVRLDRDQKYISDDGSIYRGAEVRRVSSDSGGVRPLDHPISSGFVSSNARLYTPEQAAELRARGQGDNLREVDMNRIDQGYVAPTGQVIDRGELPGMSPADRAQLSPVDRGRLNVGYVSPGGVISPTRQADSTAMDMSMVRVGYLSPQGLVYPSMPQEKGIAAQVTPIDMNRYVTPGSQQNVAKAANAAVSPTPAWAGRQQPAVAASRGPVAAPARPASPGR